MTAEQSTGNIGISNKSPNVSLDILANDAIQLPSGTSGQRPSGDNVKIGQLRYNNELDIFEGYRMSGGIGEWEELGNSHSNGQIIKNTANGNAYVDVLDSNQVVIGTSGTDHLKVTSDGKVGIGLGTSNPTTALEINGALTVGNSVINNTGFSGLGLSHKSDTENNSFFFASWKLYPQAGSQHTWMQSHGDFRFFSKSKIKNGSWASDMTIHTPANATSGNLGIGVGSPSEKLQVNGNALINNYLISYNNSTGGIALSSVATDDLTKTNYNSITDGSETVTLIDNTIPTHGLVVRPNKQINSTGNIMYLAAKDGMAIVTNNSMNTGTTESVPAMIIDNSGNIGIGTTKTKSNINLLVNGSMEVTGDITGNITANSASATKIKITNNTLDTDYFLTFTQTMVDKNDLLGNNNLKYNPLNKTLTTDIFSGTLDGNAASASKIEITQIGNSFYDPPIPNFITFPGTFDQTQQPYSERIT